MDSKQIDTSMRTRTAVMYEGKFYKRILEYVLWYDNNEKRKLSVVLLDRENCSIRVPAEKVFTIDS